MTALDLVQLVGYGCEVLLGVATLVALYRNRPRS